MAAGWGPIDKKVTIKKNNIAFAPQNLYITISTAMMNM